MKNNLHLLEGWKNLEFKLFDKFNKKPDLETILMLVGIQETNWKSTKFTKEEKQELMHVGVCSVLLSSDYYSKTIVDEDGWPHFKQLKALPSLNPIDQEYFLKDHVLLYFKQLEFI